MTTLKKQHGEALGHPISRAEALRIAKKILKQAERERRIAGNISTTASSEYSTVIVQ